MLAWNNNGLKNDDDDDDFYQKKGILSLSYEKTLELIQR